MTQPSRYAGLPVLAPGPLNARPEYAPRALVDVAELVRRDLVVEYPVTQGERIDQIAYRALGDSRLWWLIADMNPDVDPLFLQPGQVLLLPRQEVLQ